MEQSRTFSRRDMWVQMLMYPGHTLPTAAAPIIVAAGLAVYTDTFRPISLAAAFLAGWLIQLGGVLTDNYENLVLNPNDREHMELVHGLQSGMITLGGLRRAVLTCYLLAVVAGLFLFSVAGPVVLAIGLASIAASWIYSAGPVPLGPHGLADPLFFLFFGPVSVIGAYLVQAMDRTPASLAQDLQATHLVIALLLSLPVGALTTSILIIDDIRDREFDVNKGKRTVAVRFGIRWSRIEFVSLVSASYLAPVVYWAILDLNVWVLLPLVTAPLAISLSRGVLALDQFSDLVPMTPRAARLLLTYSSLLAIGVAQT